MISLFLKAKHWQLFLLTFGIPLALHIITMVTMFIKVFNDETPDPTVMFGYFKLFPVIIIFFVAIFFGWFWSVAIGLQSKIPTHIKMNVARFKIFFFIPLIYILTIAIFLVKLFSSLSETTSASHAEFMMRSFAFIVPIHVFSMFCIFHTLYFVSKTFKTVELQREISFSDFAGEFFMLWFYPVGIWIIQPKINKMAEEVESGKFKV
jgi:hypothetical protein